MSRGPDGLRMRGRNGGDLFRRFRELDVLAKVIHEGAVFDGELGSVASFFNLLAGHIEVSFVAFDVLMFRGRDQTRQPIEQRLDLLNEAVPAHPLITLMPSFDDGVSLMREAERLGLEGLVAKRRGSIYEPGSRSPNWIKVKTEWPARDG